VGCIADFIDGFARVGGLGNRVSGVFKRQSQDAAQAFFVFDEKDVRHEVSESDRAGGSFPAVRERVKLNVVGSRAETCRSLWSAVPTCRDRHFPVAIEIQKR
jgi:hypothetical protein